MLKIGHTVVDGHQYRNLAHVLKETQGYVERKADGGQQLTSIKWDLLGLELTRLYSKCQQFHCFRSGKTKFDWKGGNDERGDR
jgi:hypothetical protein